MMWQNAPFAFARGETERAATVQLKEKSQGDLINVFNTWLKESEGGSKDRFKVFSVAPWDKVMGTNWSTGNPIWTFLQNIMSLRVIKYWNKLPKEAVESPSLETVTTQLHTILGKQL